MGHNTIRSLETVRDTRSLARFGITSIQVRLSQEEALRWESSFTIGGRRYHLQGFADLGRPRGIDTDVITGLEAIFALRGFPEDNTIMTSGYELAQAAHMPDNGRTYDRIRESLLRYWRTGFLVREGFEQPGEGRATYYNETLGFFEKISFWEQGNRVGDVEQVSLSRDKTLRIVLTPEFAESLRSGYIHQLDRALLRQIEQPPARALYRLLSAHRQQDDGTQAQQLQVNLSDWRAACGIQDNRPSKVLRTLQAAHDELTAQGYLTGVDIEGRGQKTRLTYNFRRQGDPDPALVELLMAAGFGLSLPVAQQFAAEYSDRVEKAIHFVQKRQQTGPAVRSPAGLLRRVLEDQERYRLDELPEDGGASSSGERQRHRPGTEDERRWEEELEAQTAALLQAPPAEQWRESRASLKLVLGNHVSPEEWKRLEHLCLQGQYHAAQLLQEASRAAARLEMQDFVGALRQELQD